MTISIVHCNLEWDGNSRCAALATYMMPNANVKRFYDIILVMQLAHKKWLLRCNHIHENDIRNRSIESENLLEHTINEFLHSIKRDLLLEDQQYFDLHVENYLAGRSFKYNKTWCIHYNKFVPGTKTRAKRKPDPTKHSETFVNFSRYRRTTSTIFDYTSSHILPKKEKKLKTRRFRIALCANVADTHNSTLSRSPCFTAAIQDHPQKMHHQNYLYVLDWATVLVPSLPVCNL